MYTFYFFLLTALLLLVAAVLGVWGIVKKKKRLLLYAVTAFVFSLIVGVYTGFKFVSNSYKLVAEKVFEKRSGKEIYIALFDTPVDSCLSVLHAQDQVIPKVDYAISLHVRTCPEEMERVLSLHNFEQNMAATSELATINSPAWFQPTLLGDSIRICQYNKDEYGNMQLWYINSDTTEAYCIDILD